MLRDIKQDKKILISEEKQKVLQETKAEDFWKYIHLLVEIDSQKRENQLDFIAIQLMLRLDLNNKETKFSSERQKNNNIRIG